MIFYFKKTSCFYILFSPCTWYFNHFTLCRFITSFFSYLYFFLVCFQFFFYIFLEKNIIFLHFEYFLFYTGLFISFFLFLSLFFYLYFFLKNYYTKTKKMIFHYSNYNIVSFSTTLKIILRSYIFLLHTYDFYYILLYISINILIHNYIFYLISKKCY